MKRARGKPGSEVRFRNDAGDHTQESKEYHISMKRSLTLVCMLATGLSLSAVAQASPAAPVDTMPNAPGASPANTRIAVIMFQAAVGQTNEGQRDFSELEKKFAPKEASLKTQSDEIDTLKKQLQASGANLSEAERAQRTRTIDDKEKSLQRDAQDAKSDFQSQMSDTYQQLAQKVYGVLQSYVKQQGYSAVFDASAQQSPVLWINPSIDITKAVIAAYNTKSGVPAPPPSAPSAAPAPRGTMHPSGRTGTH